jgi:hypothetical protein
MKIVVALLSVASTAGVSMQSGPDQSVSRALSVSDVIQRQDELVGSRLVVRGRLSACQPLSCSLSGQDRNGRERFLSIGRSASFDSMSHRAAGNMVEIEARLTDICCPAWTRTSSLLAPIGRARWPTQSSFALFERRIDALSSAFHS